MRELLALRAASQGFLGAVEHAADSHRRILFDPDLGEVCYRYRQRGWARLPPRSRNPLRNALEDLEGLLDDALIYTLRCLEAIALPVEPPVEDDGSTWVPAVS